MKEGKEELVCKICFKKFSNIFEKAEMELAEHIDSELYLPVKAELCNKGITHSLGRRKENLKGKIFEVFEKIKKEITDINSVPGDKQEL
ncbi:MAG: hypothetical protein KAR35_06100 [Candidatus Heimdallarchaeota archaeon]|nr:hypothetical protein [Candidatus Heimdallarchaeota archaeon]MCK5048931.1 hypothetical protein [Candidatus Heimdallarchaeota archaeon]